MYMVATRTDGHCSVWRHNATSDTMECVSVWPTRQAAEAVVRELSQQQGAGRLDNAPGPDDPDDLLDLSATPPAQAAWQLAYETQGFLKRFTNDGSQQWYVAPSGTAWAVLLDDAGFMPGVIDSEWKNLSDAGKRCAFLRTNAALGVAGAQTWNWDEYAQAYDRAARILRGVGGVAAKGEGDDE
jgi:hypothetical protein